MAQKTTLARGKVQTVADLLLKSSADTAKKCRITLKEVQTITDIVCGELEQPPQPLSEAIGIGEGVFTTGDAAVDACLGGGIRTGMLWEICGENNAGKSQLAMQLALSVQLPVSQHGLEGSAYYICSRGQLHTERIHQILQDHPDLPSRLCSLDSIQTALSRGYLVLTRILNEILARPITGPLTAKPPRLIVIDTFSDYFDATKDPQYENNPALRAQHLRAIALLLHRIATKHALAVVLLSEAKRTLHSAHDGVGADADAPDELPYSDQERWFGRAHSLPGEDAHEAILGRVWPNQLNARVMMSRTTRTRSLKEIGVEGNGDDVVPFRRLTVVFSSVGEPASCDYVVLDRGVVGIAVAEPPPSTFMYSSPTPPSFGATPTQWPLYSATLNAMNGLPGPSQGPTTVAWAPAPHLDHTFANIPSSASPPPLTLLPAALPPTPSGALALPSLAFLSDPISAEADEEDQYWRATQGDDDDAIFSQLPPDEPMSEDVAAAAEEGPAPSEDVVIPMDEGVQTHSDSEYWGNEDDDINWADI